MAEGDVRVRRPELPEDLRAPPEGDTVHVARQIGLHEDVGVARLCAADRAARHAQRALHLDHGGVRRGEPCAPLDVQVAERVGARAERHRPFDADVAVVAGRQCRVLEGHVR